MVEQSSNLPEVEIHGDHPHGLEDNTLTGEVLIDNIPYPKDLEKVALQHLENNPGIVEHIEKTGKDVIALSAPHGRILRIGIGIAATVVTGAIGAIVIYKHRHHE
ncbi:hypothetical protein HY404_04240 [Candidatus Microgenomates bacterium]|nr:hypothetical protein [Candidatus Microgenomates bacterium]